MFPLHDNTSLVLACLLVGACIAIFTAMHGRVSKWGLIVVLLISLGWPWPIALYLGPSHYTMTAATYFSFWTFLAAAFGFAWGLAARRVSGRGLVFAVAILPSVAAASYMLERQRVPNALCAAQASFQIGSLTLTVPREMGARSVVAAGAPRQEWEGAYSDWTGAKPDVRALCRATNGGRETTRVSHLWFAFSWYRKSREAECETSVGAENISAYCAAIARTKLTVVQLYARPDGLPNPSLSHFSVEPITRALSAGQREGYRCSDGTNGPQIRYCTIWQQLTTDLLAVSSAELGVRGVEDDPVSDAAVLLQELTLSLGSE